MGWVFDNIWLFVLVCKKVREIMGLLKIYIPVGSLYRNVRTIGMCAVTLISTFDFIMVYWVHSMFYQNMKSFPKQLPAPIQFSFYVHTCKNTARKQYGLLAKHFSIKVEM